MLGLKLDKSDFFQPLNHNLRWLKIKLSDIAGKGSMFIGWIRCHVTSNYQHYVIMLMA